MSNSAPLRSVAGLLAALALTASAHAAPAPITGHVATPPGPDWAKNAVFYQVYPQTYADSNGDGIGDLPGLIAKLDYIRSLGADAIWINPFFDSPFNDAGYDIRDHYKVAPRYGTNDDARRLFAEAHKRGMKVLFDYVITYTAIDNPWFVESASGRPGPHADWYIWTDNVWINEPGDGWVHGYGQRNGNFLSNFFWNEPALNYGYGAPDPAKPWQLSSRAPAVQALRAEMQKVMRFWLDMGADGFRADMANSMVKGKDPANDTGAYWHEVRAILDRDYPQAFIVAEWSEPEGALDRAFHACFFHWAPGFNELYQKESWRILNGVTDGHSFFDREGKGDVSAFLKSYLPGYLATRNKGYVCVPLGNHDLARLGNRRTDAELEALTAFGITMPGVPFIYYGTEIGMRQLGNDLPQIEGAFKPRASARTPMQWAPGANLGFSSAPADKLYLPVDAAADAPTVAAQEQNPDSLLNRTRKLIRLKHEEPALAAGAEFVPLFAQANTYPLVYARAAGDSVLLVAFNPSARPATALFEFVTPHKGFELLAGQAATIQEGPGSLRLDLAGQTYAIYRLVR